MSGPRFSIIPGGAFTDKRLKPRDIQILGMLGRHTDRYGFCRRSQVKLAKEIGCARSTVQTALDNLVKAGYVESRRMVGSNGREEPCEYRVLLDTIPPEDEAPAPADPPAGISAPPADPMEPAPPADPIEPAPKNVPFRTTPLERKGERECAGAGEEEGEIETDAQRNRRIEREFKRAFPKWPTYVSDSEPEARKVWWALTDDERAAADDRMPDYLAADKANGRKQVCSFGVYLRQKKWERLPDKTPASAASMAGAKPFGKLWGAGLFAGLLEGPTDKIPMPSGFWKTKIDAGGDEGERYKRLYIAKHSWPKVNEMLDRAAQGQGSSVAVELERLVERFDKCRTDGPLWAAWKAEFEARGWPWFGERVPDWVWLPVPVDPSPYGDEAAFVRAAISDFNSGLENQSDAA